jgi:hypothetical protein
MPELLRVNWRGYSLPKEGNAAGEYEDAFAAEPGLGRFAIADGASESSFAGEWAKELTEGFVADPVQPGGWVEWLPQIRERWLGAVSRGELPWYAEQKLEDGAFATLLGLEIELTPKSGGYPWRAAAVGDACLFHLRGGGLLSSFPVEDSTAFGTRPALIGSRARNGAASPIGDQWLAGRAKPGDCFLLMTDALAQWFLSAVEAGVWPWEWLTELTEETFPEWVANQRSTRALRNDDVTLLVVEVGLP